MPFFIPLMFATGTMASAGAGAALAADLAIAGAVTSGVMGYKSSQDEASQAKKMGEYNAQVAQVEADNARNKAEFESKRQALAGRRQMDSLQAGVAAAGGLSSPVATDLAMEQEKEFELDNLLIGYEGEIQARRAESQGQIDLLAGKSAAQRAKNAGVGSLISGFTNAASIGASSYSKSGRTTTKTKTSYNRDLGFSYGKQ